MDTQYPDQKFIRLFRRQVLKWGKKHPSSFPWRYQDDPYIVLISEFMLHRTQARQVVPVFNDFIQKYPDLATFQAADEKDITDTLKSLGLTWRIRGMISALNELWSSRGEVPANYETLMDIKGIGPYIAGATVCFSLNQPVSLVDTNIVRIVGRTLELSLEGEARRRKPMIEAIRSLADPKEPRNYYYAMIDIAHTFCRPKDPACAECPLRTLPCLFAEEIHHEVKMEY